MNPLDFFRPPWRHSDAGKRTLYILYRLDDQQLLARIAKQDAVGGVRKAAISKVVDRAVLLDVLMTEKQYGVLEGVYERISPDTDERREIMLHAVNDEIRVWTAMGTDGALVPQDVYERVARTSDREWLREKAIGRLTSESALIGIASTHDDASTRHAALERIHDRTTRLRIAFSDPAGRIRRFAVEQATAEEVPWKVAESDPDAKVRRAAVSRITDPVLLTNLLEAERDDEVRMAIVGNLTDEATLATLLGSERAPRVRAAAIRKITDPQVLSAIANTEETDVALRELVTNSHFPNDSFRALVAITSQSQETRVAAAKAIADPQSLRHVADKAPKGEWVCYGNPDYEDSHFVEDAADVARTLLSRVP